MRLVMETVSLANHFLIAMPAMADPSFSRTLTYICEHNAEGAIGIIVNRPTDMSLANLFERVDIALEAGAPEQKYAALPVYFGGPVQTDRGFVLHSPAGEWQSSLTVNPQIALTSSRDILQTMGNAAMPTQVLVSLGYAGWTAGTAGMGIGAKRVAHGRGRSRYYFCLAVRAAAARRDAILGRGFRQPF